MDIAALGFSVDSTELAEAAGWLDKMAIHAERADLVVKRFATGMQALALGAPSSAAGVATATTSRFDAQPTRAAADFVAERVRQGERFVAMQQMEREALFMSWEAAARLRYEFELLNQAQLRSSNVTPEQVARLKELAGAMSSAEAASKRTSEIVETGREVFKGFFSDIREGITQGNTLWDSFGNAALNALSRITEKLIEMAATQLWQAAFPGGAGIGGIFGGGAGGTAPGLLDGLFSSIFGSPFMASRGAVFDRSRVVPFAAGGDIVDRPTFFPMAGGRTGMMGEAGEEGIFPLRRGPDGRLGVSAWGHRQAPGPVIRLEVSGDNEWVRVVARDESGRVIATAGPRIENRAVKRANDMVVPMVNKHEAERGGDWRAA